MTRTRRIVGAGLVTLATLAALALTGHALAAEHSAAGAPGLSPQRMAATAEPGTGGRGRGGYGYGATTPPGQLPSTPPGGEQPSSPPGELPSTPPGELPSSPPGEVPTPPVGATPSPSPTGVSPGHVPPGGELPETGTPLTMLVVFGGMLAVAGIALRFLARRRRTFLT